LADDIVVLARSRLSGERAALAVRVALALPLGGISTRLILVDSASALGLEAVPDLSLWSGGLDRELEALVTEEGAAVLVEQESLEELGLAGRPLRAGAALVGRDQVAAFCGAAGSCLVL
jgi:hypothetical protein